MSVTLYRRAEVDFTPVDPAATPDGEYALARLIGVKQSSTLGGGLVRFDNCSIEWTLLYDEILVVLSGRFRLRHGEQLENTVEAGPGDVLWLPNKTRLAYEGEKAELFFAVYPGNWRTLNGYPEV